VSKRLFIVDTVLKTFSSVVPGAHADDAGGGGKGRSDTKTSPAVRRCGTARRYAHMRSSVWTRRLAIAAEGMARGAVADCRVRPTPAGDWRDSPLRLSCGADAL
jgi:hypothetical protein